MCMRLRPSPKMKTLYRLYLLIVVIFGVVSWSIPLLLLRPRLILAVVYLPTLITALFILYWIERYYESITYELDEDYVRCRRGVWWRRESQVPYYRVSDILLRQGPLQRQLGLANLDFHTAALGGQAGARAEVSFLHIDAERGVELRDEALRRIGVLTGRERRSVEEQMLEELRAIRRILEDQGKKEG